MNALTRRADEEHWGLSMGPDGTKTNKKTSYGSSHKLEKATGNNRKITTTHKDHDGNHLVTVTHNYKDEKHTDSTVVHAGGSHKYLPEHQANDMVKNKLAEAT
jgi:hypothetical protein